MLFFVGLINFAAITIVTIFAARRRNVDKAHRRLFWMLFFSSLWVLSLVLETYDITGERGINHLATFADFSLAPLIAGFMTLFSLHLPRHHNKLNFLREFLIFLPLISLTILSLFGIVAQPINNSTRVQYFYPQYAIYIVVLIIYFLPISAGVLFAKLRKSHGLRRLQLKYVLTGYLFSISAGLLSSILGAAMSDFSLSLPLASSTPIIFGGFTIYAMLRYRFLDVRLAIRRGVIHTLVFGSLTALTSVIVLFVWRSALSRSLQDQLLAVVVTLVIIGFAFEPIRRIVIRWTNRLFFEKENEKRRAARAIKEIPGEVSLEDFARRLSENVQRYLDGASVELVLRSGNTWTDPTDQTVSLGFGPGELFDLEVESDVLVRDEIEFLLEDASSNRRQALTIFRRAMEGRKTSVLVPIRGFNRELIGLLLIGSKHSKDPFTVEDLDFLHSISRGTSMVLANVRMYQGIIARLKSQVDSQETS